MSYPVSACVFIRNCFDGAFALFESMASIMPFVSEFLVMDLGSTDGTDTILEDISFSNPKVYLYRSEFPFEDANVFATLANDLIELCSFDNVLYYQSDEIWHQNILRQMVAKFDEDKFDLSFWRIQYRENFQSIKWLPHFVHRVGQKGNFNFVGDGMNTDRTNDAKLCSNYNGGWFTRWGDEFNFDGTPKEENKREDTPPFIPSHEMITDISLVGAFRDNVPERRRMHAPFWHEEPHIEGTAISDWIEREKRNENWTKQTSPFDLPHILRYHIGKLKYELRPELLQALKEDDTLKLLGLEDDWR